MSAIIAPGRARPRTPRRSPKPWIRPTHLELRGIQAYSVLGSHAGGLEERKRVSEESFRVASRALGIMLRRGLSTEIVTGGSTGTWEIDTAVPDLTELQAGSYVLMDLAYRREGLDFEHALTVLATVVSANHPGFVTVDAGYKAFATDRGYGPEAVDLPGSRYRWGGDEFGYVDLPDGLAQARQPPRIYPSALRSHGESVRHDLCLPRGPSGSRLAPEERA